MILGNLQILRALAALAVVFYHMPGFGFTHPLLPADLHNNLVGLGASGVDIFFVLSGFIMAKTTTDRPIQPLRFLANRATRILPLYWIVTLALWARHAIEPGFEPSIAHLIASSFLLSQPTGYGLPYLLTGWTLEYEMLFYVIFALCLQTVRPAATVTVLLCIAVAATGGHFIILEFALGIAAFKLYARGVPQRIGTGLLIGGIALLIVSAGLGFNVAQEHTLTHWSRFLAWGVPAFFIVLGAASMPAWTAPSLKFLGDASYSLYLTHPLIIFMFTTMIDNQISLPILAQLICLSLCIGFGVAVFIAIEKPILNASKRYRARRRHCIDAGHAC